MGQKVNPFVKFGLLRPGPDVDVILAVQDLVHLIIRPILIEQIIVDRKILGDLLVLQVLAYQPLGDLEAAALVDPHGRGQVGPAAGGGEGLAVQGGFDLVKIALFDIQIGRDGRMDPGVHGVFLPRVVVRLDIDALQAVPGHNVKLADGVVVFRRVSGGHHDPAVGDLMTPEYLVLQKLEHGGGQRFRDAVDLVQEQNALLQAGVLHHIVDGGDDLAHRVFRYAVLLPAVGLFHDKRQAEGALTGMVAHGVADQADAELLCDLLHDRGLADTRRAHQKQRALFFQGDLILAEFIFGKIGKDRVADLFLRILNVHPAFLRFLY